MLIVGCLFVVRASENGMQLVGLVDIKFILGFRFNCVKISINYLLCPETID